MKYFLAIVLGIFFVPVIAYADIRITEIAWMGTTESQYGEWFELYNNGDSDTSLAGWKITDGAGATIITLSKTIPAGEYILVERVTSSQNPFSDITDEEGTFAGGGLSNVGEDIVLVDKTGTIIQELSFADGWPAGDAASKKTMQWNGGKWITADPTPKEATSGTSEETADEEQSENSTALEEETDPIPKVSPNKPNIVFTIPSVIYDGVPYTITATPILEYNYRIDHGSFFWNMGDGSVVQQDGLNAVIHTYEYPGTYTIYFSYAKKDSPEQIILSATKKITVKHPKVELTVIDDKAIEIKNNSGSILDLTGWQVRSAGATALFPQMTFIEKGATVTIPYKRFPIDITKNVSLIDPIGSIVATTEKNPSYPNENRLIESTIVAADPVDQQQNPDDVVAVASEDNPPKRNRTKMGIIGAVALFVIALSLLLERFMARQE